MRKVFLILLVFIISNVSAQEFNGGFQGGFTASQVDGDTHGGYNKPGIIFGVFANRKINSTLTIQTEIVYSQRGSKKNINVQTGDYFFYKMHLEYIEVPIIAQFKYNNKISFEAGLSNGVLVKAYEDDGAQYFVSHPFYKYAISSVIGINYKLTEQLIINLRETYSIRPIRGYAEYGRWWYKTGQYSNSLSFMVYYQF